MVPTLFGTVVNIEEKRPIFKEVFDRMTGFSRFAG